MKLILALLLFPCLAHAQYRPYPISTMTPQALMNNFNQAAIRINRSLDKYGNDTIYGRPTFNKGAVFSSSVTLPTRDKIVFGNQIHNSSGTVPADDILVTQTSFAVCQTTLTITTNGNSSIAVNASGTWFIDTAGERMYLSYRLDGGNIDTQKNAILSVTQGGSSRYSFSLYDETPILSAGTHSVCFSFRITAGELNVYYADNEARPKFWIKELR